MTAAALNVVRVVSDGTPKGTVVMGPDGKGIPGITKVVFWIEANGTGSSTVVLTIQGAHVEVTAGKK